jgi:7,8-dihydro-6-hydroxymethylpterin-pyrophosphokinase
MRARAFVLAPLAEIRPGWRDPQSGLTAERLLAQLPVGFRYRRVGELALAAG